MKCYIIQPGRLGDILLCLPIAKHYYNEGYDVIWPVLKEYADIFDNVSYVQKKVLPEGTTVMNAVRHSYDILAQELTAQAQEQILYIDLSFGFPGTQVDRFHNNTAFASNFVEAKYKIAGVEYDKRWSVEYTRNLEKEKSLFDRVTLNRDKPYTLVHDTASCGKLIDIAKTDEEDIIRVEPIAGYNIFDWYMVAERANKILCVDSSFCNFIESIPEFAHITKYYSSAKPMISDWGKTPLRNNWIML